MHFQRAENLSWIKVRISAVVQCSMKLQTHKSPFPLLASLLSRSISASVTSEGTEMTISRVHLVYLWEGKKFHVIKVEMIHFRFDMAGEAVSIAI